MSASSTTVAARRRRLWRLRTAAGILGSVLIGLAIGAALLTIVATTMLGFRTLDIASDSMAPALNRGDLVISRPVDPGEVKVGDVIVFSTGEQQPVLLAHRVVAVSTITVRATSRSTGEVSTATTPVFRTKGDANPAVDGAPVDVEHYRGVVWLAAPGLGLPLLGLPLSQVFLVISIATAIVWAAYEGISWVRRRPRHAEPAPVAGRELDDGA